MQTMVEMQQETVNNIEKTTEHAVYDLEQGNKHVSVAVKTAKMTRKVSKSVKHHLFSISDRLTIEKVVLLCYLRHLTSGCRNPHLVVFIS